MRNRTTENSSKTKANKHRRASGISWRLFGALIIFVALVLAIIWVIQVAKLNSFYERYKLDEFVDTEDVIFEHIGDEKKMSEETSLRSVKADTCIRLFKMVEGEFVEIASSEVHAGCMIHELNREGIVGIYNKAVNSGGSYSQKVSGSSDGNAPRAAIKVSLKTDENGQEYVLMMSSDLVPLEATVQTLERQFGWIMCLLIMGALVIALVISRVICTPLERMSRSARKLAKGDYNEKFIGGGYKEAEQLAEALNYAASELAKVDNLQREIIANISHDLRTPLTMIKGYSEIIRDIPGENTPENVQVIIDETERLTQLVNDVLDLSRIKSGTRKPEREIFDLTETVRTVLTRYEKLTEKNNYSITFTSDESVFVNADRTMILQVVYNLVNNALNYTGEDKKVCIDQSVWDGRVRISVIDTGSGIADEDIPYIWDRYYKVDKVHKCAMVGTGLGLSIVKGILESHDAPYGVVSKIGEGSNFWFELDIANPESEKGDKSEKAK